MAETDEPLSNESEKHNAKMRKLKVARDKLMETKTEEKGLIIVHTGNGKGKTTAGMGMVCRAIGHNMKTGVIQFIKGSWATGEKKVFDAFPDLITMKAMGEGFTWETQDRDRDIAAVQKAWSAAKDMILSGGYEMVLCDEINIALRYDYLDVQDVLDVLAQKPHNTHVILTGRNAPDALIDVADLVTSMEMVKHPFKDGIKAQPGIEF